MAGGKTGSRKHGRNKEKCKRYRSSHRLRKRKIRNLVLYCRLSLAAATKRWEAERQRS